MSSPILNVADTAFWIAHYRAEESQRPDAVFVDGLARTLAGDRGRQIALRMPGAEVTRWQTVVRTRVIDELIAGLVKSSAIDAVVNLGAGLDARPYRMDLPADFPWTEVDQHEVIEFKTRQLSLERPRCALERHAANLANADERRAVLASACARGKRVLVLTEGVVPYLSNDDVAALASELKSQPAVVGWIAEYVSERVLQFRRKRMGRSTDNARFLFQPPEWFAFFEAHGWKPKDARYLAIEGERIGRPFPAPLFMRLLIGLTRLVRRGSDDGFKKTMAYVLYERA